MIGMIRIGACQLVEGSISPMGWCDLHSLHKTLARLRGPFTRPDRRSPRCSITAPLRGKRGERQSRVARCTSAGLRALVPRLARR
jgi:hypothetical protein